MRWLRCSSASLESINAANSTLRQSNRLPRRNASAGRPVTSPADTTAFLCNCWYIAALPEEISTRPLARRIAGEPIVLFLSTDGSFVALADRCCHRGVPLHLGTVIGNAIQCAYHGFTFDQTGACIRVPSQKVPPQRARVRSFPLIERHGFVWIWMGWQTPVFGAIPDFSEITAAGWTASTGVLTVHADYRRVIDNILDLSHVSFVHRSTFGSDDAEAKLEFKEVNGSVEGVRRGPPMPTPPLYRRLGFCAQIQQTKRMIYETPCHVKAPIQTYDHRGSDDTAIAGATRSATICVFNSLTPETATTCHYFWASARNFALEDAQVTELIREQTLKAFREDQLIVEAEQQSHIEGFNSGVVIRADIGGVMARRTLARRIERECAEQHSVVRGREAGAGAGSNVQGSSKD
jgi:phenylpropionate dioxygenase-like ring-hydroxylating dioxygenase large terminal subunit